MYICASIQYLSTIWSPRMKVEQLYALNLGSEDEVLTYITSCVFNWFYSYQNSKVISGNKFLTYSAMGVVYSDPPVGLHSRLTVNSCLGIVVRLVFI